MKPDWKDAPEWANWLAMDSDGEWRWYEYEPTVKPYSVFWSLGQGRQEFATGNGQTWKDTLETRPEEIER